MLYMSWVDQQNLTSQFFVLTAKYSFWEVFYTSVYDNEIQRLVLIAE